MDVFKILVPNGIEVGTFDNTTMCHNYSSDCVSYDAELIRQVMILSDSLSRDSCFIA